MEKLLIKMSQEELIKLKMLFEPYIINLNSDEVFFQAVISNTRIIAYNNGNLSLSGSSANAIKKHIYHFLNNQEYNSIGINVEGITDIFGPLVLCSAFLTAKDIENLKKMNLDNNVKLSDFQVNKIAPFLMKNFKYAIAIIDCEKYNSLRKIRHSQEKILAHYINLLSKRLTVDNNEQIIIEKCIDPKYFMSQVLRLKTFENEVVFYDNSAKYHFSCYVASIIARYYYLQKLSEYSTSANVYLIKGNSEFVTTQLFELKEHPLIEKIAKMDYINKHQ